MVDILIPSGREIEDSELNWVTRFSAGRAVARPYIVTDATCRDEACLVR